MAVQSTSPTVTEEILQVALLVLALEEHCCCEFCVQRLVPSCRLSSLRTGKETLVRSQQIKFWRVVLECGGSYQDSCSQRKTVESLDLKGFNAGDGFLPLLGSHARELF